MRDTERDVFASAKTERQPAKRVTVVLVLSGDTVTRHFQYPVDAVRFMNRNRKCVNGAIVRLGGFSGDEFSALLDYHHISAGDLQLQ